MKEDLIEIEIFSEEESVKVFEILQENFEHPWSLDVIKQKNPFSVKLVAKLDRKTVGFLSGEVIVDEGSILMIAVKKDFQRRKIGETLLKHFFNILREKGAKKVFLEVSEKNKSALNFYRKSGFKVIHKRKKYYKNGDNALVMEKDV